jgi:hypothetical protein
MRRVVVEVSLAAAATGCVLAVMYLTVSAAVFGTSDVFGLCEKSGDEPDGSDVVIGDARWRWVPPGAECVWAVDAAGSPVGPPDRSARILSDATMDDAYGWAAALVAPPAVVSTAVLARRHRRLKAPNERTLAASTASPGS